MISQPLAPTDLFATFNVCQSQWWVEGSREETQLSNFPRSPSRVFSHRCLLQSPFLPPLWFFNPLLRQKYTPTQTSISRYMACTQRSNNTFSIRCFCCVCGNYHRADVEIENLEKVHANFLAVVVRQILEQILQLLASRISSLLRGGLTECQQFDDDFDFWC